MKKILVALALFPMAAFASGITPGTVEVAGGTNLGFTSGSSKLDQGAGGTTTTDTTKYGLNGTGLYYVTPNLAVGARLGYTSQTDKVAGVKTLDDSTLFLGPAAAYELEVAPQISVFGLAALGYARETALEGGSTHTGSGFGFGLEAGAKYFLVKNFSFNAALAYDWQQVSFDSVNGVTPKKTDSGFGVNLGLSVYFGGASH